MEQLCTDKHEMNPNSKYNGDVIVSCVELKKHDFVLHYLAPGGHFRLRDQFSSLFGSPCLEAFTKCIL